MTSTEPTPPLGPLFDLFCAVQPFPRERSEWIEWIWDVHKALLRLDELWRLDKLRSDFAIHCAKRVAALLYDDRRGSTPWGGTAWTAPKIEREQVEQHLQQGLELLRQLKQNTFESGGYPTNDLFSALRELPEEQRLALQTFPGISGRLMHALQAFWCAE